MRKGLMVLALALVVAGTASAQGRRNSFQPFPGVDGGRMIQTFDTRDPNVPIAVPQQRSSPSFSLSSFLPKIPSFTRSPFASQSPSSTFPTPAEMPGLDYLKAFQYRLGQ